MCERSFTLTSRRPSPFYDRAGRLNSNPSLLFCAVNTAHRLVLAQDKQTVEVVSMSRSQGSYEEKQGRRPPVQKAVLFMAGYAARCVFVTQLGFTGVEHPGNELLPPSAISIRFAR
ncbi:uncharacterized [Tachysurus ichikawai]